MSDVTDRKTPYQRWIETGREQTYTEWLEDELKAIESPPIAGGVDLSGVQRFMVDLDDGSECREEMVKVSDLATLQTKPVEGGEVWLGELKSLRGQVDYLKRQLQNMAPKKPYGVITEEVIRRATRNLLEWILGAGNVGDKYGGEIEAMVTQLHGKVILDPESLRTQPQAPVCVNCGETVSEHSELMHCKSKGQTSSCWATTQYQPQAPVVEVLSSAEEYDEYGDPIKPELYLKIERIMIDEFLPRGKVDTQVLGSIENACTIITALLQSKGIP